MFEFAYTLGLEITHPEMDSGKISATLGILPDIQRTAGQDVVGKHGERRKRKAQISHWLKYFGDKKAFWSGEVSISDTITRIALNLAKHKPFFKEIRREDGEVSFSLACFNVSGCAAGTLLNDGALTACLKAGIQIDLSFYDLEHTPKEIVAAVPKK
jgi:hypothetical protein